MNIRFGSVLVWTMLSAMGGCSAHLDDLLDLPGLPDPGSPGTAGSASAGEAGAAGAGGEAADVGAAGAGGNAAAGGGEDAPAKLPGQPIGADGGASEPPLPPGDAGAEQPIDPPAEEPPAEEPPVEEPPAEGPPVEEPPAEEPPVEEPPAGADAGVEAAADAQAPAVAPSFGLDVWPITQLSCDPCHTTARLGGHSVGSADLATALADAQRLGERVLQRLESGTMPPACAGGAPGDEGCIGVAELAIIRSWIESGMAP